MANLKPQFLHSFYLNSTRVENFHVLPSIFLYQLDAKVICPYILSFLINVANYIIAISSFFVNVHLHCVLLS